MASILDFLKYQNGDNQQFNQTPKNTALNSVIGAVISGLPSVLTGMPLGYSASNAVMGGISGYKQADNYNKLYSNFQNTKHQYMDELGKYNPDVIPVLNSAASLEQLNNVADKVYPQLYKSSQDVDTTNNLDTIGKPYLTSPIEGTPDPSIMSGIIKDLMSNSKDITKIGTIPQYIDNQTLPSQKDNNKGPSQSVVPANTKAGFNSYIDPKYLNNNSQPSNYEVGQATKSSSVVPLSGQIEQPQYSVSQGSLNPAVLQSDPQRFTDAAKAGIDANPNYNPSAFNQQTQGNKSIAQTNQINIENQYKAQEMLSKIASAYASAKDNNQKAAYYAELTKMVGPQKASEIARNYASAFASLAKGNESNNMVQGMKGQPVPMPDLNLNPPSQSENNPGNVQKIPQNYIDYLDAHPESSVSFMKNNLPDVKLPEGYSPSPAVVKALLRKRGMI